ncbi:MAG: transcription termination/antitermination protein NusA [Deltaproteobacteria bacterium]|nr:transcription termination/antitermination protein NusA [Deltaproteobacteria bacterium]
MSDENLTTVLDVVSKEKGIDRKVLIQALEEAILASAKRAFGAERNLLAQFNAEKGAVDLTQTIKVVENIEDVYNEITVDECSQRNIDVDLGDEMVFPIYYLDQDAAAAREQDNMYGDILRLKTYRRGFGRIAAQTAKQVIIQRIRDAERNIVYTEYKDRKGELVTGIVRRFERGNIIVDLGRAEAVMPMREQVPRESYRAADRIQAYVIEVQEHARGPQIVLSRTCPELLVKLFELEVPEIYEGIVKIESAAREPGARAKIAVSSTDRDVDPVGACVGMKGSRVQAVVQELRGEKIDIVPYSEDPATFVCNALQPAEVSRVLIDEGNHAMEIIVPDDQLSLAIGRKGQNVRLASQLTGWRLDIHSESRIAEIKDKAWKSLSRVDGLNEFLIQTLYNHGIRSAQQLFDSQHDFLMQFPGMDDGLLDSVLASAKQIAAEEKESEENARVDAERAQKAVDAAKRLQEILGLDDLGRLQKVRGVGESMLKQLQDTGFIKVEEIADASVEDLAEKLSISESKAKQLKYAASQWLKEENDIRSTADELGISVEDGIAKLTSLTTDVSKNKEQSQSEVSGSPA